MGSNTASGEAIHLTLTCINPPILSPLMESCMKFQSMCIPLYEERGWKLTHNSFTVQLESTLEQYLSSEDESMHHGGYTTTLQGSSDVHAMFAAKRRMVGRKGQGVLSFRFDSSRHAISINTYMKEQRDLELVEVSIYKWHLAWS